MPSIKKLLPAVLQLKKTSLKGKKKVIKANKTAPPYPLSQFASLEEEEVAKIKADKLCMLVFQLTERSAWVPNLSGICMIL